MNDEGAPARRLRFRWWMVPAALGAAATIGLLATFVAFLTREDPDAMPVEEVVEEFRAGEATTGSPAATPHTTDRPRDTTEPTGSAPLRPRSGVYVLEGAGHEAISFPPVTQDDGTTMPATVVHLDDGCWSFTIHYNEAHWQDWELCPDGDALFETGGHTFQRWDFGVVSVENTATFVCDPPARFASRTEDGSPWPRACEGTNDTVGGSTLSSGELSFVGIEPLTIGEETVDAVHFRTVNTISGAQTGEERSELWLARADWLPLRGERDFRVDSDSPVGAITYTEAGWWQLTSTEPQR